MLQDPVGRLHLTWQAKAQEQCLQHHWQQVALQRHHWHVALHSTSQCPPIYPSAILLCSFLPEPHSRLKFQQSQERSCARILVHQVVSRRGGGMVLALCGRSKLFGTEYRDSTNGNSRLLRHLSNSADFGKGVVTHLRAATPVSGPVHQHAPLYPWVYRQ